MNLLEILESLPANLIVADSTHEYISVGDLIRVLQHDPGDELESDYALFEYGLYRIGSFGTERESLLMTPKGFGQYLKDEPVPANAKFSEKFQRRMRVLEELGGSSGWAQG